MSCLTDSMIPVTLLGGICSKLVIILLSVPFEQASAIS